MNSFVQAIMIMFFLIIAFVTIEIGFKKTLLYVFDIGSNELIVEVKEPLLTSKVKIELSCDDFESVVIYDGEEKHSIANEYGIYYFLIRYNNKYYAKIRHFRSNWHDQYHYSFKFEQVGKRISLSVEINDTDWQERSLMMKPIGDFEMDE